MVHHTLNAESQGAVQGNGQHTVEKIILAQELERRKWALELHDGVTQSLANIYCRLQAHRRLISRDPARAAEELEQLEGLVSEAMTEARALIDDLRPSVLDDIGLVPAIAKYLKRVALQNGMSPALKERGDIPRSSCEEETAVYRVVHEALTNVRKHSRATEVTIDILCEDGALVVTVTDNGTGFDVQDVDVEGDNWGLIGMRERAEIVGGVLTIESAAGAGTSVSLRVPLASKRVGGRNGQQSHQGHDR